MIFGSKARIYFSTSTETYSTVDNGNLSNNLCLILIMTIPRRQVNYWCQQSENYPLFEIKICLSIFSCTSTLLYTLFHTKFKNTDVLGLNNEMQHDGLTIFFDKQEMVMSIQKNTRSINRKLNVTSKFYSKVRLALCNNAYEPNDATFLISCVIFMTINKYCKSLSYVMFMITNIPVLIVLQLTLPYTVNVSIESVTFMKNLCNNFFIESTYLVIYNMVTSITTNHDGKSILYVMLVIMNIFFLIVVLLTLPHTGYLYNEKNTNKQLFFELTFINLPVIEFIYMTLDLPTVITILYSCKKMRYVNFIRTLFNINYLYRLDIGSNIIVFLNFAYGIILFSKKICTCIRCWHGIYKIESLVPPLSQNYTCYPIFDMNINQKVFSIIILHDFCKILIELLLIMNAPLFNVNVRYKLDIYCNTVYSNAFFEITLFVKMSKYRRHRYQKICIQIMRFIPVNECYSIFCCVIFLLYITKIYAFGTLQKSRKIIIFLHIKSMS